MPRATVFDLLAIFAIVVDIATIKALSKGPFTKAFAVEAANRLGDFGTEMAICRMRAKRQRQKETEAHNPPFND